MRIRSSWTALVAWRAFSEASNQMDRSIGNLSSGLRVNRASDDVAGLSISERMRAQFQSLAQANRNVLDGISLVQTGESALQEITTLLQRARELAVQGANGTYSTGDKKSIQVEADGIIAEIDRIVDSASFNGRSLLSPSGGGASGIATILTGLRSGWLSQSEAVIRDNYGLIADGATIKIVFHETGVDSAWISGDRNSGTGHLDNLTLHINLASFGAGGGPDGGAGPLFNDRKVARALTQAVLARNTDYNALGQWFISGASDYIAGRNEQLTSDIAVHGVAALVNAMGDAAVGGTWVDDSLHRSAAYAAMHYLADRLTANGFSMTDFMGQLAAGASIDPLLSFMYGGDLNQFVDDFVNVFGITYVQSMPLTGPDVGGVGGGDASAVIPNGGAYSEQPLEHLRTDWSGVVGPELLKPMKFVLQVGANVGDTLTFELPVMTSYTLNLLGLDYVNKPMEALDRVSGALAVVNGARTLLGSMNNRLEHTLAANTENSEALMSSYSRIRDLDFARSVSDLTRQQILISSSGAMLAQANTLRQNVKWLLNGISSAGRLAGA